MGFLGRAHLAEIDDDGRLFELTEPLVYVGKLGEFTVPVGFVTDFASIPRVFWPIVGPYGRHTRAAILHDWLYQSKIVSRSEADAIFRRAMKELGVEDWKRWGMWLALRTFGWWAWNGYSFARAWRWLRDTN